MFKKLFKKFFIKKSIRTPAPPVVVVSPINQSVPVGNTEVPNADKPTKGATASMEQLQDIVYLVVIVLFVGFIIVLISVITLFIESFNSKQESYENLQNQVLLQNQKMDDLTNAVMQSKSVNVLISTSTKK